MLIEGDKGDKKRERGTDETRSLTSREGNEQEQSITLSM